ncbi:MAG: 50S ribosomal protein L10 [Clostridiaceae bacterium]|jgi:large subunit ribosomal protein L10|nr:50S ribosomal protein L10 [Clostridiaceae bacterium]
MPSEKILEMKKKRVDALAKELENAQSIVFADYKGLTVEQDTEMRAEFRNKNLTYKVVKNSISSRAFDKLGIEGLDETLTGPTAIAYSNDDVVLAPRLVREFSEKFRKMSIKGGIVGKEVHPLDYIMALSRVESRENLYGKLLFMMLYPLTAFAQVTAQIAEKKQEDPQEVTEEVTGETEEIQQAPVSEADPEEAGEPVQEKEE